MKPLHAARLPLWRPALPDAAAEGGALAASLPPSPCVGPGGDSVLRAAPSPAPAVAAGTVALYFVASPLQYLAARRIAATAEAGSRQVLVWYKHSVANIVRPEEWDATAFMPWPRWEPLPGAFGRHRRLRANIALVAALVGHCERLHIHSAVFDTEAINYFLRALPPACGARSMHARILPDGIISTRRYPLSLARRLAQLGRKLRRLAAPELDYWCFGGDRIGSDAPFCDRIYVLPGLPHAYPAHKVAVLPPLVEAGQDAAAAGGPRRALVVGQPLTAFGLMRAEDLAAVTAEIRARLDALGIDAVDYKPHPKDRQHELTHPDYRTVAPAEPLERFMAARHYHAVLGVRSSALLFARQLYGADTVVEACGWSRIRFKSAAEREDMARSFEAVGVVLRP
ncbi:hypothetical protein dqs_2447 [Azoarcus olearius]|uniref:polysialyltransferase family glycosyltransferase n=1 Tax=Azoarcus sp. (strain BH72) TaxID=418699 RepID=UPI000806381A|nr:polysialyltransferase family glycosyltransferase [Azoarcus olearius]ANQ85477.1 hypothetical protein dqs_2447 [Azoarcus olearius]